MSEASSAIEIIDKINKKAAEQAWADGKVAFVEMQKSPHTRRAYALDILKWEQFIEHFEKPVTDVNVAVAFKRALEDNYAASTAQRVFSTVAAFHGWMKGTGRISASPFLGVKSPTRPIDEPPAVPSDEDISKFFNACEDGTPYGNKTRLVASLLLNGLRAQEVCDSKIEDLTYDEDNRAWVLLVHGKGDKFRRVPINSEAQQAIFDWWLNGGVSQWLVPGWPNSVTGDDDPQLSTQSVYRMIKHYGSKAGLHELHPHAMRHHYATRMVRNKVDLFTLQKLLGHARADTTQRYVALDNTDLVKALIADPRHKEIEGHYSMPFGKSNDLAEVGRSW